MPCSVTQFSTLSPGTLRLFVKSWLPLPMQWMPCVTQPCVTLLLRDLTRTLALVGTGATRSQPSHPGPLALPSPSQGTWLEGSSSISPSPDTPARASILPGASTSSPRQAHPPRGKHILPGQHPGAAPRSCTPWLGPAHPPWGQHRRARAGIPDQRNLLGLNPMQIAWMLPAASIQHRDQHPEPGPVPRTGDSTSSRGCSAPIASRLDAPSPGTCTQHRDQQPGPRHRG